MDNEKTAAGPKSTSNLGIFFPFFKWDLVELDAQSSNYNLSGPGDFSGNVFIGPSSKKYCQKSGLFHEIGDSQADTRSPKQRKDINFLIVIKPCLRAFPHLKVINCWRWKLK